MIDQKDLHLIFPFIWRRHRVSRIFLCKTYEKKEVRIGYIRAFKDMNERDSTSVKTQGGTIKDSSITIGLHQKLQVFIFLLRFWKYLKNTSKNEH